ncbi:MAG: RNA polymerase sigma factor [Desulfitobacteriia bacterium]|jgi:RNA polymerase sigma-70 factor (ECF subfamily)
MVFLLSIFPDSNRKNKLEVLYREHALCMYKIACEILKDEHLAQDAVQEAFIKIANILNKIDEKNCNKTRALFVILVRNLSIDIYRKRKRQQGLSIQELEIDLIDTNVSDIEETLIREESFARIAEKIKELHLPYADILTLKYFYYYSNSQISEMLKITPENTKIRLHRAKKAFKKLLQQEQEGYRDDSATI